MDEKERIIQLRKELHEFYDFINYWDQSRKGNNNH